MSRRPRRFLIGGLRWTAILLAVLASGPFITFLLFRAGEVLPKLSWRAPNHMPLFVAWLAVMAGVLVSLRWQMIGGLVMATSAITVGVLGYLGCGAGELLTCTLVAGPYLISGLLLLGCCWAREQLTSSELGRELAS
jgi:hypothetical protein